MKKLVIIFIIIFMASPLNGCFISKDGESISLQDTDNKVTLRFINSWGGIDSNAEALQEIIDNFMEKYPHITVVNDSVAGSGFLETLKTDFITDNAPDVFGIWPGSDISALIEADKVADLTQLINGDIEWKSLFGEDAWEYCTYDGSIYGLPVEIIYEAIFVNTQILHKYDLEIPQSYEQLCNVAKVLNTKGITTIAYNYTAEGTYFYQNLVVSESRHSNIGKFNHPYKESLYKMLELYNIGAFPQRAYRLSDAQRNDLFLNGEAAMIVQGSWFTRDIYNNGMADYVEIIPMPTDNDTFANGNYNLVYGLGCGTFYMSESANEDEKRKEASILLLKELTSPEASEILCTQSGFISNIDMSSIEKGRSDIYRKGESLVDNAYKLVPPPDLIIDRDIWQEYIVDELPNIYVYGEEYIESLWQRMIRID